MAWTTVESVYMNRRARDGIKKKTIKLECTSDTGSESHALASGGLRGLYLYGIEYFPDGVETPTSDPVVTIENENGFVIFNSADTGVITAATATYLECSATLGSYPLINGIPTFKCTTLADTKEAAFILNFIER